ncbi:LD-carboxypeptidase [Chitinophagales bacterium]|nr:LD-carboxypeptidase [Chitinophagales bacterium]
MHPPYLKPGDTVGLVCTARSFSADEVEGIRPLLESWGLTLKLGKTIGAIENQFGGSDTLRQQDLQEMLDDPSVAAVFCARGGYGTVRILDGLDWNSFTEKPKWIVGFSDVTALHATCQNETGIASLHGPLLSTLLATDSESVEAMRAQLFGEMTAYDFSVNEMNKLGIAEGTLVGGNLSVLYSLLGSTSFPDTDGAILFLEDLDEYRYHIDRMMMALKRAGKLSGLAGVLVGGFAAIHDNAIPFGLSAEAIIVEHLEEYAIPMGFGFPAGHGKENMPLIIGSHVAITLNMREAKISWEA